MSPRDRLERKLVNLWESIAVENPGGRTIFCLGGTALSVSVGPYQHRCRIVPLVSVFPSPRSAMPSLLRQQVGILGSPVSCNRTDPASVFLVHGSADVPRLAPLGPTTHVRLVQGLDGNHFFPMSNTTELLKRIT